MNVKCSVSLYKVVYIRQTKVYCKFALKKITPVYQHEKTPRFIGKFIAVSIGFVFGLNWKCLISVTNIIDICV